MCRWIQNIVLFLSVFILCQVSFAANYEAKCRAAADQALSDYKIVDPFLRASEVEKAPKGSAVYGVRYWYGAPICPKGYIVVHTNSSCHIIDVYTHMGCYVPAIDGDEQD
jgi:hypothetical protein